MTKTKKSEFRPNDYVVYPAHGVGQIMSIEEQDIAGITLELFVISFEKDKMTLRVPTNKATEVGMRSLSSPDVVSKAMATLKSKAKVKKAMWSRRAQEYEQKINSGDLIAIAEVVRDLHRADDQRPRDHRHQFRLRTPSLLVRVGVARPGLQQCLDREPRVPERPVDHLEPVVIEHLVGLDPLVCGPTFRWAEVAPREIACVRIERLVERMREGEDERPVLAEHPSGLRKAGVEVLDPLERVRGEREVERVGGERQIRHVADEE